MCARTKQRRKTAAPGSRWPARLLWALLAALALLAILLRMAEYSGRRVRHEGMRHHLSFSRPALTLPGHAAPGSYTPVRGL